jgi:ribosome-associated protein
MPEDIVIPPNRVVPGSALRVKTARASGPGGQHVNRTESKIQLSFDPTAVPWLKPAARQRLYRLAGQCVNEEGRIQIVNQQSRDQARNLEKAREKLTIWIERALVEPKDRRATRPTRASKERRLRDKQHRAAAKLNRSRVPEE